jgi:hypothetical protein
MNRFWGSIASSFVVKRLPRSEKIRLMGPVSADLDNDQTKPLTEEKVDETTEFKKLNFDEESSSYFLLSSTALGTFVLLSLLFSTLVVGIIEIHGVSTSDTKIMVKPCGSSPEEARAKGCHFDVISFNWLPDECYDDELSQEFDHELEWFLDQNRTQPLSHEQIMTGEHTGVYVNWEYHLRHCTAMWKKFHRAVIGNLGKQAIDSYIGSYQHSRHCELMVLADRSIPLDVINTRITLKYPDCGI